MKTITIGVTGAIGSSNIENYLIVLSQKYKINLILTENAQKFVSKDILKYYSNSIYCDFLDGHNKIIHTYLGQEADIFIILPATANIIGKIANGIADDLLTSAVLNYNGSILIAPNMNPTMWENRVVKDNVNRLKDYGHKFINQKRLSYIVCDSRFEEIDCALPTPKELLDIIDNC